MFLSTWLSKKKKNDLYEDLMQELRRRRSQESAVEKSGVSLYRFVSFLFFSSFFAEGTTYSSNASDY